MHLTPHLLLSATDLTRFMGCQHATVLDLAHMRGEGPEPKPTSEDAALLQRQGEDHEAAQLDALKSDGRSIIEIPRGPLAKAAEATRAAVAEGADVIYQSAFLSGPWGGWADFLEWVDTPSALGPFSYDVADTVRVWRWSSARRVCAPRNAKRSNRCGW